MIKKTRTQFPVIQEATCDCCGANIEIHRAGNWLMDHMSISGYQNGEDLSAIICIKCMEEKLGFINIRKTPFTTGHC